jgi:hypothetical protein
MAVTFCIVASKVQDQQDILIVANATARIDPVGRKVLRRGDLGFPSEQVIAQELARVNVQSPGAMVLRGDGSVFEILPVDKAKNGAIVEDRFARAAAPRG